MTSVQEPLSTVVLDKRQIKELSQLSLSKVSAHIVLEWSGLFAGIACFKLINQPWLYPLLVIWLGARQQALITLLHDGYHYRIHKNRRINDLICDLVLAWPFFVKTHRNRNWHLAHHAYTNDPNKDPDIFSRTSHEWQFPMPGYKFILILFQDVLGLTAIKEIVGFAQSSVSRILKSVGLSKFPRNKSIPSQVQNWSAASRRELNLGPAKSNWLQNHYSMYQALYYVIFFILILVYLGWINFIVFWIIPYLTWVIAINRIRTLAEHGGLSNTNVFQSSRVTYPTLIERSIMGLKNFNYHLDHHLYTSVPFYNLPKLHKLLLQQHPYDVNAHITHTYLRAMKECVLHESTLSTESTTQ